MRWRLGPSLHVGLLGVRRVHMAQTTTISSLSELPSVRAALPPQRWDIRLPARTFPLVPTAQRAAFSRLSRCSGWLALALEEQGLSDFSASCLVRCVGTDGRVRISTLSLSGNAVGDGGAGDLAQLLSDGAVRDGLDLSRNRVGL